MLEDGQQEYFSHRQIGKRICAMFDGMGHQQTAMPKPYMDRGEGAN